MSVYTLSSDKNIFNLPKALASVDINTRNEYNSTIVGFEAGQFASGPYNTIYGYRAASLLTSGGNNVFVGAQAGANATSASDNLVIGNNAAKFLLSGTKNVILGNNSGYYLNGNQNILVGFNNTTTNDDNEASCNISIGYRSSVFGNNNVSLGNDSYVYSTSSITLGSSIIDTSTNSIILGNNIVNTGSNVFILNNRHNSNNNTLSNSLNNYVNINDVLLVTYDSNNRAQTTLAGDTIRLSGCNISLATAGTSITFGDIINLQGKYSALTLGQSVSLGPLDTLSNNSVPTLNITSNSAFLGNSNSSIVLASNDITLKGSNYSLLMDPSIVRIGLSNSNALTMSNGVNTFVGTVALCNNLIVQGNITGKYLYLSNDIVASNAFFNGSIDTSSLVVNQTAVFNGPLTGTTATFSGQVQTDDLYVKSNLYVDNDSYLTGTVYMQNDTYTYGVATYCNDVNITGDLHVSGDVIFDGVAKFSTIEADNIIGNNAILSNNLQASNITANGELRTYGTAYFYSNIEGQWANFANDLTASNVRALGELVVSGTSTFNSNLIGQSAYFSNDLTASNITSLGQLVVSGTSTFNSNLIGQSAYFSNDLTASNITSLGQLVVSGTSTFNSNLIGQSAYFSNDLTASNVLALGQLVVSGTSTFNSNLIGQSAYFSNDLTASNIVALGNLGVSNNLIVNSNVTICNDLNVFGTIYGSNGIFNDITVDKLHGDFASFSNVTFLGNPTFCNGDINNLFTSNGIFYYLYASNAELSNTSVVGPADFYNTATFHSNIILGSNVSISNAGNLYITGGGIHVDERTLIKDLVVYGSITLCNGATTSNIGGGGGGGGINYGSNGGGGSNGVVVDSNYQIFSNLSNGHFTADVVRGESLVEFEDSVLIHDSLYVCSNIYTLGTMSARQSVVEYADIGSALIRNNLTVNGVLTLPAGTSLGSSLSTANGVTTPSIEYTSNSFMYWKESIDIVIPGVTGDLVFTSRNGSVVTFTDDFHPEVLNFTGKHRCLYRGEGEGEGESEGKKRRLKEEKSLIGKLVVATGKYCNLDGKTAPELDEAIPVVSLCKRANDKRVFGVFAGFEDKGEFHVGNITFRTNKRTKRAIVQSVGEGCMWVCNANGPIRNGDFLCSSPIPGYAMRQDNDLLLNTTVAKTTCRCTFVGKTSESKVVMYKGKKYRASFIGVTYKM